MQESTHFIFDEEKAIMRLKQLIDDEAFKAKNIRIQADLAQIDVVLDDFSGNGGKSLDEVKKAFNLIVGLSEVFTSGTYEQKQEALSALGSNLTIKDKKVNVYNKEIFKVLSNGLSAARAENDQFEPRFSEADKDETDTFVSVCPTLLRTWEDVRLGIVAEV